VTATLYPGRVVGLSGARPLVLVPQLALGTPFGPLETLAHDLAVGEQVVVTNMGGTRDQLLVLGRMVGRAPTIAEIPGLRAELDGGSPALDARLDADEATIANHGTRLTTAEGTITSQGGTITSQGTRLTTAEGTIGTQGTRLTTAEGTIASQGTRLTTAEGTIASQGTRLTATEGVANAAATATALATLRADTADKVDAKGDLLAGTANNVLGRLAVGADGLAVVADSAQGTGLAYAERRGVPLGLTGAAAATRYVGGTAALAPSTGTFAVGDYVIAQTGVVWVCTAAGSPGTWVAAEAPTRHAHYDKLTAQSSLTPGTLTAVGFETAVDTHADVTPNGAFTQFTLNRAGVWLIEAGVRITGTSMAATFWEGFAVLAALAGDNSTRYGGANTVVNAVGGTAALSLQVCRRFAAAATVAVNGVANNSSGSTGTWQLGVFSGQTHISLTYLGA